MSNTFDYFKITLIAWFERMYEKNEKLFLAVTIPAFLVGFLIMLKCFKLGIAEMLDLIKNY